MAKPSQVVKKRWVQIFGTALFGNAYIGETYVAEPKQMLGRDVTVSLMTLTNDPQKQSVHVHFKVTKIEGDKALADFLGYRILPGALRRLVRKARDKFEDSFIVKTKDDVLVRVKPFVVTRTRATGGTLTLLQRAARTYLAQAAAANTFEKLTQMLLNHDLQHETGGLLKKVFPVSACEIKWYERVSTGKPIAVPATSLLKPKSKETEQDVTKDAEPESPENQQTSGEQQAEA